MNWFRRYTSCRNSCASTGSAAWEDIFPSQWTCFPAEASGPVQSPRHGRPCSPQRLSHTVLKPSLWWNRFICTVDTFHCWEKWVKVKVHANFVGDPLLLAVSKWWNDHAPVVDIIAITATNHHGDSTPPLKHYFINITCIWMYVSQHKKLFLHVLHGTPLKTNMELMKIPW